VKPEELRKMNDSLEAMRRDARSALGSVQAVTARIEELLGGPPASSTYKRKAEREAKYAEMVAHGEAMARLLLDCHAHLGVQNYEREDLALRDRILPLVEIWRKAIE
jgi:hypothetical protein